MSLAGYEDLKAALDRYHGEGSTAMVEQSWSQPSSVYSSAARLELELRHLFDCLPVVAAHSSELSQPDAFVAGSIVGTPLLLVRQADGTARAFLNACRHRGVEIVSDGQTGCARRFTCRYHGWTYDGSGTLVGLPSRPAFDDRDHAQLGLTEVACAERHGLVFAARRPGIAIDLSRFLGPMDAVLHAVRPGDYAVERRLDFEVAANWKLVVDGFLETYHVGSLHGASLRDVLYPDRSAYERLGPHGRLATPRRIYDPASHRRPEDLLSQLSLNHRLFPNTMLTWFTDHFELWQIEPDLVRPGHTRIRMALLVRPDELVKTRKWDINARMSADIITGEDFVAATSSQRTLDGGAAPERFVYGQNEPGVQHFHQEVADALGRAADVPSSAEAVVETNGHPER